VQKTGVRMQLVVEDWTISRQNWHKYVSRTRKKWHCVIV